jgi:type I restriction enzyme, S subunit
MTSNASRLISLAEIADLSSGGTPSRAVAEYFTGSIPWIKTLDLNNDWVETSEEAITEDALRSFRGTIYPPGTVVVAMYGGAGTIGKSGILAMPAAINQALCAMPPRPDRWDSEFLQLWLRFIRPRWMSYSAGNRKDPNINKQVVANMRLRLPELPDQVAVRSSIRAKLSFADECLRAVESQRVDSAALMPALLHELIPVVAPVSTSDSASLSHGWRRARLGELARLESGHTPSRRHPEWWGGHVPWLALPDIRKLHGKLAYETTENINDAGLENSSARLLPVGTVCVSRTASIGFVTMLGRPMATSQDFCNWVCDPERLDPEFLMFAFMASQHTLRELGSGAVHKTIYMPTIQSFHICAPDIEEQRRIARMLRERLAAAEALTGRLRERRDEIERLPQRLLAAAFDRVT